MSVGIGATIGSGIFIMTGVVAHHKAGGAGALGVAAAAGEKSRIAGRRIAAVISGGNVDCSVFSAAPSHTGLPGVNRQAFL
jgi:threonine dehydratase